MQRRRIKSKPSFMTPPQSFSLQPVILAADYLAGLPPLHPSATGWETKMDARSWLSARTDLPLFYWPFHRFYPSLHSQFVLPIIF